MVKESEWPYFDEDFDPAIDWPPEEPPGLDTKAKNARVHYYQRIRSVQDCRKMLANGFFVSASFNMTEQWFTAEHGLIMLPQPGEEFVGGHCVSITGFELTRHCFIFENSWGKDWGACGHGYLSFEYFEKYLIESWQPHGIGLPANVFSGSGVTPVQWSALDTIGHGRNGGEMVYIAELYDR
jgi:hypothetical protein